MNDPRLPDLAIDVGAALPHESAALHVAGDATYTDDLAEPRGTLHAAIGVSPLAHATLRAVDLAAVRAAPGVVDVIVAADIPGQNDVGPIIADDPILADGMVHFAGQPVFAVAATSVDAARRAAALAKLDLAPLPPILSIEDAMEARSFVLPPAHVTRGDAPGALARAPHRLSGSALPVRACAIRSDKRSRWFIVGTSSQPGPSQPAG